MSLRYGAGGGYFLGRGLVVGRGEEGGLYEAAEGRVDCCEQDE